MVALALVASTAPTETDLSVHKNPNPCGGDAWNVMFRNGTESFEVRFEE